MQNIEANLNEVRREIAAAERKFGRPSGAVRLLAVSKMRPIADIVAAARAGQRDFGENYVQEAVAKIDALRQHGLCWHFIGPIQSNKTRLIGRHFDWVHCVDRIKIATRLNAARPADLPALNVCIQVNISGERTKSGIEPDQALELAESIAALPKLRLRGLMTMPALTGDFAQQRRAFQLLHQCYSALQQAGLALDTLSMGTTGDMQAAIAEGASMVRLGTAIFGPRQKP